MDDRRPTPTAQSARHHDPESFDDLILDPESATPTGGLWIEPSPPFRSGGVLLDDGRTVGLTEPDRFSEEGYGPIGPGRSRHQRRTLPIPIFPRSPRGGIGTWFAAVPMATLAVLMLGQALSVFTANPLDQVVGADDTRSTAIETTADAATGELGDQRGSRARTTGEVIEDTDARVQPETGSYSPSGGQSGGPDLNLGHRSSDHTNDTAVPGVGEPAALDTELASAADPDGDDPGVDTIAGSITTTTTSGPVHERATDDPVIPTGDEPDTGMPGSIPSDALPPDAITPDSTPPVPEPGTPPPPAQPPVSRPPVTVRPTPSTPPAIDGPPSTRPPAAARPSTTRKPTPADTRPSRGIGRGRDVDSGGRPHDRDRDVRSGGRPR